jgi:hypothetical protein
MQDSFLTKRASKTCGLAYGMLRREREGEMMVVMKQAGRQAVAR